MKCVWLTLLPSATYSRALHAHYAHCSCEKQKDAGNVAETWLEQVQSEPGLVTYEHLFRCSGAMCLLALCVMVTGF